MRSPLPRTATHTAACLETNKGTHGRQPSPRGAQQPRQPRGLTQYTLETQSENIAKSRERSDPRTLTKDNDDRLLSSRSIDLFGPSASSMGMDDERYRAQIVPVGECFWSIGVGVAVPTVLLRFCCRLTDWWTSVHYSASILWKLVIAEKIRSIARAAMTLVHIEYRMTSRYVAAMRTSVIDALRKYCRAVALLQLQSFCCFCITFLHLDGERVELVGGSTWERAMKICFFWTIAAAFSSIRGPVRYRPIGV